MSPRSISPFHCWILNARYEVQYCLFNYMNESISLYQQLSPSGRDLVIQDKFIWAKEKREICRNFLPTSSLFYLELIPCNIFTDLSATFLLIFGLVPVVSRFLLPTFLLFWGWEGHDLVVTSHYLKHHWLKCITVNTLCYWKDWLF